MAAIVTTFPALVAEFHANSAQAPGKIVNGCNKAAFDTQARAKVHVPRDTGFLSTSVTVTPASIGNPVAEVGPEANYGRYVEEGTSRMAAQPYMAPAVDEVSPGFEQAMTDDVVMR